MLSDDNRYWAGLGVFQPYTVQGTWSLLKHKLIINSLVLRAIRMALQGHPIRVQSDNAMAVTYINHRGHQESCSLDGSKPDNLMYEYSLSSDFFGPQPRNGQLECRLP